jgi:hypothetical protein
MLKSYQVIVDLVGGDMLESLEHVKDFARGTAPGTYRVVEYTFDPFVDILAKPRFWGQVVHSNDGQITLHPTP